MIALVAATVATVARYTINAGVPWDAHSDFDHIWASARFVLQGIDPYTAIGPHPGALYRFELPPLYPLSTVAFALPLSTLPLDVARAVFVGGSFALLTLGLTRRAWWPLWWLLGFPAIQATLIAQWSPLLVGAALLSNVAGDALLVLKPQDGLLWVLAQPSRRRLVSAGAAGTGLALIAWTLQPDWLASWRQAVALASHIVPPAASPWCWPALLVALLHRRSAEGRLLLLLCILPVTHALYAMLPVGLTARSPRQLLGLVACSLLAEAARRSPTPWVDYHTAFIVAFFWPAAVLVWWNGAAVAPARLRVLLRRPVSRDDAPAPSRI